MGQKTWESTKHWKHELTRGFKVFSSSEGKLCRLLRKSHRVKASGQQSGAGVGTCWPKFSFVQTSPTDPFLLHKWDRWHLQWAQGSALQSELELPLYSLSLSRLQHPVDTWSDANNIPVCTQAASQRSPASALLLIGQQRGEESKAACWWSHNWIVPYYHCIQLYGSEEV